MDARSADCARPGESGRVGERGRGGECVRGDNAPGDAMPGDSGRLGDICASNSGDRGRSIPIGLIDDSIWVETRLLLKDSNYRRKKRFYR